MGDRDDGLYGHKMIVIFIAKVHTIVTVAAVEMVLGVGGWEGGEREVGIPDVFFFVGHCKLAAACDIIVVVSYCCPLTFRGLLLLAGSDM